MIKRTLEMGGMDERVDGQEHAREWAGWLRGWMIKRTQEMGGMDESVGPDSWMDGCRERD